MNGKNDATASIADILAHAVPTAQLKELEHVGEQRVALRKLNSRIKTLAHLSSHMFIGPLIGFPAILIPLSLNILSLPIDNTLWYTFWSSVTGVLSILGLLSLYLMHDNKVALGERLSQLKSDGAP